MSLLDDNGAASPGGNPNAPPMPDTSKLPVTSAAPVQAPNIVKPVKRGGLAGIVDEFRDAIAGEAPGKVYTDADGNKYIQHPDSTGNKWLRVMGTAVRGAAAGAANGQGPGGNARALEAGIKAEDQQREKGQQQDKEQNEEVRQAQLDKFNSIKLKHDMAAREFELQRMKVTATHDDAKFSQEQNDYERKLVADGKAQDLGVFKDEAELADKMKTLHPDFWKDAYSGKYGRINPVPEIGADGVRTGVHFYIHMPSVNDTVLPAGSTFKVAVPPKKPGDPWTIGEQTASEPMNLGQQTAYNTAAYNKVRESEKEKQDSAYKASEITRNKGEAAKDFAEAGKIKAETEESAADAKGLTGPDYLKALPPERQNLLNNIHSGAIVPENLARILSGKQGQKLLEQLSTAYPGDIDTSRLSNYPKLYQDFTSGKTSQTLQNLNSAFKTIRDLKQLNTYSSRLPVGPTRTAYDNKLTTAAAEIANGLAKPGATATKEEIANVRKSLDTTFSRDRAIDTQIQSLVEQYTSIRDKWNDGAPSPYYQAKMPDLGSEARAVIQSAEPALAQQLWGNAKPIYASAPGKPRVMSVDGGKTWQPAPTQQ